MVLQVGFIETVTNRFEIRPYYCSTIQVPFNIGTTLGIGYQYSNKYIGYIKQLKDMESNRWKSSP